MNGTLPAIGCTRLSDRSQTNGYGQEAQAQDIQAFAQQHSLILGEIIDEVQSGATDLVDRDVVQTYYSRAKATPGQPFIFPRVDRLGRLAELIIGIARQLIRLGAMVYVVGFSRPLDPKGNDWLTFQFKAMMAEQDYLGIMTRTMNGKLAKAQANGWPSGKPPWGYRMTRDERGKAILPEPDPQLAPSIVRLFELRASMGTTETAQQLNREGWPAPGQTWNAHSVRRASTNRGYAGEWAFGSLTLNIPAIVTVEAFEAAQRNNRERFIHRGPRGDHLLSGVAYCAACGAAMTRTVVRRSRKVDEERHNWYYRCWKLREKGPHRCTNSPYWPQVKLEEAAWQAFVAVASDAEQLRALVLAQTPPQEAPEEEARAAELDTAIRRAWEPYVRGVPGYTFEMATAAAQPYVEQQERYRSRQLPERREPVDTVRLAQTIGAQLPLVTDPQERRRWLQELHVKVYVGRGGIERVTMDVPDL